MQLGDLPSTEETLLGMFSTQNVGREETWSIVEILKKQTVQGSNETVEDEVIHEMEDIENDDDVQGFEDFEYAASCHGETDIDDQSANENFINVYQDFAKPGFNREESALFPYLDLVRSGSILNLKNILGSPNTLERDISWAEIPVHGQEEELNVPCQRPVFTDSSMMQPVDTTQLFASYGFNLYQ